MPEKLVEERRMLAPGPLDAERAIGLVEAFAGQSGFGDNAELKLQLLPSGSVLRVKRGADWAGEIRRHWDVLATLTCYDYGQDPAPRMEIDVRTGMVSTEVPRSVAALETTKAPSSIAEALGLTPVRHDLYRYRSTAVTYQAAGWDLERFAEALEGTIANLTNGREPVVVEAYYTYEHKQRKHVERLRGFFAFPEMIESLRNFAARDGSAANLLEIELSVEGPAEVAEKGPVGRALGVYVRVLPSSVRITFLSSLAPDRLAEVILPIRQAVELGKDPVPAHVPGSSASGPATPPEERFWVKYLATPIIAALITALVSTTVLQAILSDYELRISQPVPSGEAYTMARPGQLDIRWHLRTTDALWRRRDFDAAGVVQVIENGEVVQEAQGRSAATVTLAPGSYVIVVRTEREVDPARITVTVKDPDAPETPDAN